MVAAAEQSSQGLRRNQSPELASGPPQGTELSLERPSSQRLTQSGAPFNKFLSPERSSGASQETELLPERSSAVRYAVLQSEFQERARDSSSDAESVIQD